MTPAKTMTTGPLRQTSLPDSPIAPDDDVPVVLRLGGRTVQTESCPRCGSCRLHVLPEDAPRSPGSVVADLLAVCGKFRRQLHIAATRPEEATTAMT